MIKYINYAIVTIDDDVIYTNDTIYSLFKSYIKFPNLVSARRVNKMKLFPNGELKPYNKWEFECLSDLQPSFDLFATGVGGVLYPPNIFNLNLNDIPKIFLNLFADDIYLKYLEIKKGIEVVWVKNNKPIGNSIENKIVTKTSLAVNNRKKYNDIYLKMFNILIKDNKISKFCGEFPRLISGKEINLKNIHNITYINKSANSFSIEARSDCPINITKKFHIFSYINNFEAHCKFNKNEGIVLNKSKLNAFCEISKIDFTNFNNLIFPYIKDDSIENTSKIIIKSPKINLKTVFRQAYNMKESNGKIIFSIEVINLDNKIPKSNITLLIKINNITDQSICKLIKNTQLIGIRLIIGVFLCEIESSYSYNINNINIILINSDYITGINNNIIKLQKNNGNIPIQFTINKIISNNINKNSFILKGVTSSDIIENINFSLFITFYNKQADCILYNTSKLIQTLIICNIPNELWPIISIESQIILKNDIEILLIKGQENIISEKINSKKLINCINFTNQINYFNHKIYDSQKKFDEYEGNLLNNHRSNEALVFHLNPRLIETFLIILLNLAIIIIKLLYIKRLNNKIIVKILCVNLLKIS